MTDFQKKHGPFAKASPGWIVPITVTCEAGDRIRLVRESTDPEWLVAVIKDRNMQTTVRLAAERRFNKLRKEQLAAVGDLVRGNHKS